MFYTAQAAVFSIFTVSRGIGPAAAIDGLAAKKLSDRQCCAAKQNNEKTDHKNFHSQLASEVIEHNIFWLDTL
jgi:hypothetical protein